MENKKRTKETFLYIRIESEFKELIKEKADENFMTMTEFVLQAVRDKLK